VPLLEQVLEKYPKDVKVVFKNFPLRMHKFGKPAATAALAAGKQGKFWEFHDLLFKDHNRLNQEKVEEIARELNLDMEKFEKDLKDPSFPLLISRDMAEGNRAGVRGTPTVFVNGKRLRRRNMEGFQELIEQQLKKTSSP